MLYLFFFNFDVIFFFNLFGFINFFNLFFLDFDHLIWAAL